MEPNIGSVKARIDWVRVYLMQQAAKLQKQLQDEGLVIFDAPERRAIDDGGGYGDIDRDERPDFLKDINEGWEPLFPDE